MGAGGNSWDAGTINGTGNTTLQVNAQGGSGRIGGAAQAKANASGVVVDVTASADVGGSTTAASQAAIAIAAPWASGLGAIAAITGAALPASVAAVLAAAPNTAAALGTNATVIALGELGGAYSAAGTTSQTSTATTDITFDQALLAAQPDLLFSLYRPTTSGAGITGIDFSLSANGTPLLAENFATAASATTWCTDHPVDLGTIAGASTIDLHVALTVTTTTPASSFDTGFLVADRM